MVSSYANDMVDQAVENILAGDVKPQAVEKGTCKYCPVQALCAQAETNCRGEAVGNITFETFKEVKHE